MGLQEKIDDLHCEKAGVKVSLENTEILTKISAILSFNKLVNPRDDIKDKVIYSEKGAIKYFNKVSVPDDLKESLGELYGIVEDEDDIEQSTALLSRRGKEIFVGQQLVQIEKYLNEYELIRFPENILFIVSDNPSGFKIIHGRCEFCDSNYISVGKKYMAKKIVGFTKQVQKWGTPSFILPGYDLAVSDCSEKNPIGTGYLFSTDKVYELINLCSNECAVGYCSKNDVVISFIDFINKSKLRILSQFTKSINTNMGNDYKYRSSNI